MASAEAIASAQEIASALKIARPKALATLIRLLGGLDPAEDALQEALARALEVWPQRGLPDNPSAWLIQTGRNKAIDQIRRRSLESAYCRAERQLASGGPPDLDLSADALRLHLRDDLLRLVFTCCHPSLSEDLQIALTLKTIAGLSVEEIARAFLLQPRAMEQRLVRAKRRLAEERVPYEVPDARALPGRLGTVLSVVYLIFNEGYKAHRAPELVRRDLCLEALRLARLLKRLYGGEPEVGGLLALILLQHSRRDARLDGAGDIVALDEQDRGLWDRQMIVEGQALVEQALRRKQPGPYQIQAAIAALHAGPETAAATDWAQIAELYGILERYQGGPVVRLNRAVAIAKAGDLAVGLAMLDDLSGQPEMQRYHHFHAARAALLAEAGDAPAALERYEAALGLAANPAEQAYLRRRIGALRKI
ncbi:RNA polymerase sigma factor [Pelagibius sp.]|uniref:RNA polymerase sigma factor n=1 Tax=Pelagibius sp. TaxID=1931238 RepID=UPI0026048D3B|nr:DUF6596 domain-containing protein [Pelagibius sp.]